MDAWSTLASSAIAAGAAILASFLTNQASTKRLRTQFDLEREREKSKSMKMAGEEIYNGVHFLTDTLIVPIQVSR